MPAYDPADPRPVLSLDADNDGGPRIGVVVEVRVGRGHPDDRPPTLEQRSGVYDWRPVHLIPDGQRATGRFRMEVRSGNTRAFLRVDPHARARVQGDAVPVDLTMKDGARVLARRHLAAGLTTLSILPTDMDAPARLVRRNGRWAEFDYTITNHSRSDYPRTQVEADVVCVPSPEPCPRETGKGRVTKGFRAQWHDGTGWRTVMPDGDLSLSRPLPLPFAALPAGADRTFRFRFAVDPGELESVYVRELQLHVGISGTASGAMERSHATAPADTFSLR
ncbi:hypothetical protein ABZ446_41870 [Streptomyces sp. NPDC005813]|uniref:hypothetical protein n=1 Tax=Streptomyces sp. NPDC005813 TaxID=3155592 RepID=UPI0033E5E89E